MKRNTAHVTTRPTTRAGRRSSRAGARWTCCGRCPSRRSRTGSAHQRRALAKKAPRDALVSPSQGRSTDHSRPTAPVLAEPLDSGHGGRSGAVPQGDGSLRDRGDGRDRLRPRRRTGRDHGELAELGSLEPAARHGRPRSAPAHRRRRSARPAATPSTSWARSRRHISDCFAGAPSSRRAGTSSAARRGGRARPACRSSTDRSPRSSARSSRPYPVGDHDLFIGRVDALANDGDHPPLLYFRRRYLRVEKARAVAPRAGLRGAGCRPSAPTGSTSATTSSARRRRRATADPDPAPRRDLDRGATTGPPSGRSSARRSGPTCPMPAATAGPAGTWPTAGPTASSWTTSRRSWTPSGCERSTSPASRWGR